MKKFFSFSEVLGAIMKSVCGINLAFDSKCLTLWAKGSFPFLITCFYLLQVLWVLRIEVVILVLDILNGYISHTIDAIVFHLMLSPCRKHQYCLML